MVAHGECEEALREIESVLLRDPTNAETAELKKRVDSCGQPVAEKARAARPIDTQPIEQFGLPVIEGENEKTYQARVAAMGERYTDAESAFAALDYARAITLFESILRDAGPRYQRVTERLAESKARLKDGAQKALLAAREFESKGDFARAIDSLGRAQKLDSSLNVDADIKRLTATAETKGRQACDNANARYSYGRNDEALSLYQEAFKLLPADHPCIITARERFPNLRR